MRLGCGTEGASRPALEARRGGSTTAVELEGPPYLEGEGMGVLLALLRVSQGKGEARELPCSQVAPAGLASLEEGAEEATMMRLGDATGREGRTRKAGSAAAA